MNIEKFTRKSHCYNEDRFLIKTNLCMVIDGATSLKKTNLKPTDGSFFASEIKRILTHSKSDVLESLNFISKFVFDDNNLSDENNMYLPSAGLAWAEFDDNIIKCHTIGDCEIIIKTKDKKIIRLRKNELINLDNIAKNEMIKIAKSKNISIKESRLLIEDLLLKHRLKMNKEGGYDVFTPSKNPNFKYLDFFISRDDVEEIYIYTDGFADAYMTLGIFDSYQNMFKESLNIQEIVDEIVDKCKKDSNYNLYPRFKLIDDITIIKIIF